MLAPGRTEAAHAQAIGPTGEDAIECDVADGRAHSRAGRPRTAASGEAIAPRLLIGRRAQATAGAAVDHEGFVGVCVAQIALRDIARRREILRAGFGGGYGDVLKSGLLRILAAAAIRLCVLGAGCAVGSVGCIGRNRGNGRLRGRSSGVLSATSTASATPAKSTGLPATSAELSAPPAASGGNGPWRRIHFGRSAVDARNRERPIAVAGIVPDRDLPVQSVETEHFDVDIPDAGGEIERVAAILIGVGNHFRGSLVRGDGGAGNKLIGGPNGAGMLNPKQENGGQGKGG